MQGGVSATPAAPGAPNEPLLRRIVLIADSYPPVLAWTTRAFQCAGWEVLAATDARNARERWDESVATDSPVTLFVTDLDLPGLDGASLARDLRHLDQMLAVVALSGQAELFTAWPGPLLERTAFLRKPVRAAELVATAEALCGARHVGDLSP